MQLTMIERSCPICATNGAATLFAEANINPDELDQFAFASRKVPEYMHWRLWQCGTCDLLYGSPTPRIEDLANLYKSASFSSSREAAYASHTYGRILAQFAKQLPDMKGALDIGTGDGVFLRELLNQGFTDVTGVEPSAAPIAAAEAAIRPLIQQGLFEPGKFALEKFSLVTCFQTIEHVPDPLGICREALRILKPGGAFFLIGHNRRAFSAKALGRRSPIFDIEHLQLFSPASFRYLLKQAGFARVELRTVRNIYPLAYWAQLLPFPRSMKKALLATLNFTRLGRIPVALPAGNIAAIGYK